jgi:hypothetical protein
LAIAKDDEENRENVRAKKLLKLRPSYYLITSEKKMKIDKETTKIKTEVAPISFPESLIFTKSSSNAVLLSVGDP